MRDEVLWAIIFCVFLICLTLASIFSPPDGGKQPCKCQAVPAQTQAK